MADPVEVAPGHWQVRVFINRHPVTGEIIRYRADRRFEAVGKRRAKAIADQKKAAVRAELVAAYENPTPTVRQAADQWWELWSRRNRSPTTRKGYDSILRTHIHRAPFADKKVNEVTVGELDRWYLSIAREPGTVRRIDAVLSQVFEQCERDGTLTRNPAALAHKPEARAKQKKMVPVGTLNLVLDAAAKRHPARGRTLAFAALTGLRRGEMCGLRHSDIDHQLGAVTVAQAVVVAQQRYVGPEAAIRGDGRTKAILKGPKAHQVVAIALGSQAAEIAGQQADWQRSQPGCPDNPFLWSVLPPFDDPLNPDTLTNWFAQAAKDMGVRGFTLHDLRHWQGSQVLEVGGTVQDAKERLRHKSLQTTMGYLHADHSKQKVLVDLMPRLELPASS